MYHGRGRLIQLSVVVCSRISLSTLIVTLYCLRRKNKESEAGPESVTFKAEDEEESGEGLTTLIPDIRATAKIVEVRFYANLPFFFFKSLQRVLFFFFCVCVCLFVDYHGEDNIEDECDDRKAGVPISYQYS